MSDDLVDRVARAMRRRTELAARDALLRRAREWLAIYTNAEVKLMMDRIDAALKGGGE